MIGSRAVGGNRPLLLAEGRELLFVCGVTSSFVASVAEDGEEGKKDEEEGFAFLQLGKERN